MENQTLRDKVLSILGIEKEEVENTVEETVVENQTEEVQNEVQEEVPAVEFEAVVENVDVSAPVVEEPAPVADEEDQLAAVVADLTNRLAIVEQQLAEMMTANENMKSALVEMASQPSSTPPVATTSLFSKPEKKEDNSKLKSIASVFEKTWNNK